MGNFNDPRKKIRIKAMVMSDKFGWIEERACKLSVVVSWQSLETRKQKVKQCNKRPDRPRGFQEVEASRLQDNRLMQVVRLSAICTGRL